MSNEPIVLSEDQLRDLMQDAVEEAFLRMGVRADDPTSILEMQRDFIHVRKLRTTTESIGRKAVITGVGVVITAVMSVLWLGFTALFGHSPS